MKEPEYIVDSIEYNHHSEYLRECDEPDTRLAKIYRGEGQYTVVRAPSLESNRRLEYPSGSYIEIRDEFDNLLNEVQIFDINVPEYDVFVSSIHTKQGHEGEGLCIASKYIHGKCLPLEDNGMWDSQKELFYERMEQWLNSISLYMASKYLSNDFSENFLSDICRPIQFVYSFDNASIYLVDLDPFYEKIVIDENLNERFLIGLRTLSKLRNKYFNKGISKGYIDKSWGTESKEILKKLVDDPDFQKQSKFSEYSKRIMKNLENGLR